MERYEVKRKAKDLVSENYLTWILPVLLGIVLNYSFKLVQNEDINFIVSISSQLVTTMIGIAIVKYYLAAVRTPEKVHYHLWDAIKYTFTDALGPRLLYGIGFSIIKFVMSVLIAAPFLVVAWLKMATDINLAVVTKAYHLAVSGSSIDTLLTTFEESQVEEFLGVIFAIAVMAFVLFVIWGIVALIIEILFAPFNYIIQDNLSTSNRGQKMGFFQAIGKSYEMMKGHRFEYMMIFVSMIGWYLTCIIVLPLLYVIPYQSAIIAIWMDELMKADGTIADFGMTTDEAVEIIAAEVEAATEDQDYEF